MTKAFGNLLILLGVVLLCGAAVLTWQNIQTGEEGGEAVDAVISVLHEEIPNAPTLGDVAESAPEYAPPEHEITDNGVEIPDYILNPKMKMPVKNIDGINYIGYVQIPALGLELPVISETSDELLKVAPCRYEGSAYLDNLIIGGHNYRQHFGKIGNLSTGDAVTFVDMDGNVFYYQVAHMEVISANDVEGMVGGEWDLSLFTCNLSRSSRITIRCEKVE